MNLGIVLRRGFLKVSKHSPEILLVAGVVGGVCATVMACKATLRADEVLDKHTEEMAKANRLPILASTRNLYNDEAFAHKDKLILAYDDGRFSHNARIGAQIDCNISKHFSINLELSANTLRDRFNSKLHNKGDWQLVGQLGVTYKFAAKKGEKTNKVKVEKEQVESAEVW